MKRALAFVLVAFAVVGRGPVAQAVDLGDGIVHLRHEAYSVREGPSVRGGPVAPAAGTGSWVVAFQGPAGDAMIGAIEGAGGRVVGYVPSNAYLVRADGEGADRIGRLAGVLRVDAYPDEWKLSPDLDRAGLRAAADPLLFVEIWQGDDPRRAAADLRAAGVEVLRVDDEPGLHRLLVRAGPDLLDAIATVSEVQWVEEIPHPTLRNDTVRWIIQSNDGVSFATPLHARGLFGAGEIIGHVDEPPYLESCYFRDEFDNIPGPAHRKIVALRRVVGPSTGSHGTHTAGTAAGENVDPAFPQWRGMAPKARLSCSSWYDLNGEFNELPSNLGTFLTLAHEDGARIHTNSYGDDDRTSYTSWCVDVDAFSRLHEEDLVVFAVSNLSTIRTPENAKNCLATASTYSAPNQHLHASGGVGPTADGRRKPEVYAPGRDTRSAAVSECATALSTGTSMSAPAVAGGAALVREYYRRGFHPTGRPWAVHAFLPTGALLKATVVNSTVDMTGVPGYPSNLEGWGRILLDDALYFHGDVRRLWLRDVRHAEGLSTGRVDRWDVEVVDASEPLAVTMAFMDQPAVLGAAITPVNDLDLEVVPPGGGLYRGNVIDVATGESMTGGSPDALNDVERVLLASPAVGTWTIRVRGASVPLGPQGYAVVVNGGLSPRDRRRAPAPPRLAVSQERGGAPPAPLTVGGASPNPFRGSTTLEYSLPDPAMVKAGVYDVGGRLVRELLSRPVEAGEHRLLWDGRDGAGRRASPGIYFFRLETPGAERVVKTVLLR